MQGSIADGTGEGVPDMDSENLQMRNWVVNSVLENEKSYIDDLNVLIQVCATRRLLLPRPWLLVANQAEHVFF